MIGTGKRTGKTAVAGHWATLLRERGTSPVIVSMGRGGPAEPQLAGADTSLADLRAIAADGRHAASDYLEDAAIAGVPTVGCRRVGGGLVGEPFESNVAEGAALAALLGPDTLLFEGSGACIPPVEVQRTLCVVGAGADALYGLGSYHLVTHLKTDYAVLGEPSANMLALGHRGRVEVEVTITGKSVHASVPATGVNPLYSMARFLLGLETLTFEPDPQHLALGPTSVAPTP